VVKPLIGNVNVLVGPGHTASPLFQTIKEAFENQNPDDEHRLRPANLMQLEWLHGEKDMLHSIIKYQTDLLVVVPIIRPMKAGQEDVQRLLSLVEQAQDYTLLIFAVNDSTSQRILLNKCQELKSFTFAWLKSDPEQGIIPVLRKMEPPTPRAFQDLVRRRKILHNLEKALEERGRERLASRLDPKVQSLMSPLAVGPATK
jgi:hypothetical protein